MPGPNATPTQSSPTTIGRPILLKKFPIKVVNIRIKDIETKLFNVLIIVKIIVKNNYRSMSKNHYRYCASSIFFVHNTNEDIFHPILRNLFFASNEPRDVMILKFFNRSFGRIDL